MIADPTTGVPLPPFPPARALPDRAALHRLGVSLRAAAAGDLGFIAALYASTRDAERLHMNWPADAWARFVAAQFTFQHQDLVRRFGGADFLVVMHRDRPVGRLYLDRTGSVWRIVDVALVPQAQGKGLGAALVRWVQQAAIAAGAAEVDLHVLYANPAAGRLYAQLGFSDAFSSVASHRYMTWSVPDARSAG